jgi:hypothetical protein
VTRLEREGWRCWQDGKHDVAQVFMALPAIARRLARSAPRPTISDRPSFVDSQTVWLFV